MVETYSPLTKGQKLKDPVLMGIAEKYVFESLFQPFIVCMHLMYSIIISL